MDTGTLAKYLGRNRAAQTYLNNEKMFEKIIFFSLELIHTVFIEIHRVRQK